MPKRVLILAATTGYQTRIFEETARRIGYDVVMGTDRCRHMDDPWGDSAVPVRFQRPEAGAAELAELNPPPDGVIAVGDRPTELAALTAEKLGLRFHPHKSVVMCRNKFLARERFRDAGMLVPEYFSVSTRYDVAEAARSAQYPCVLKPLGLSGSRGVIRANDEMEFADAFHRITAILDQHDIRRLREDRDGFIQIEEYIPGREFAVEGVVMDGRLKPFAIFDKPDPLEGPFFEETIYVTPSRETAEVQHAILEATQQAVTALGLTNGPLHAEMRVNSDGVWMLEAAARPIGGLCAKSLRFQDGMTLEEVLLRFATGEDIGHVERESAASGVMMIPIPTSGVFHDAAGIEEAASTPHVTEVAITATRGQRLLKLPEGSSYLGFIFARAEAPEDVETALRQAHSRLRFEIMAELPALNNAGPNY